MTASRSSPWQDVARQRLERLLAPAAACALIREVLEELRLEVLESAADLSAFAQCLIDRGGFLAVLGASLQTHAKMRQIREQLS